MAAQARSMLPRRCPAKQHLWRVPGAFLFPQGHNWLSLGVVGMTHVLPGESWDPFLGRNRSGGRAWFRMSNFSWKSAFESSPHCQFRFSGLPVPKPYFFSLLISLNAVIASLGVTNPCSWLAVSYACSFQTPGWRFPCPSRLLHVMLWLWLPLSSILSMSFSHLPPCLHPTLCSSSSLSTAGRVAGWLG